MKGSRDKRREYELPAAVYAAAQVRELDRIAIEERGIAGYELMTRAARAALEHARARWPAARRVLIYCGAGNNAGDGYVFARLARDAGLDARVVPVVAPEKLKGDAARAWGDCRAAGVPAVEGEALLDGDAGAEGDAGADGYAVDSPDLVVDALLGTGLDRPLEGAIAAAVERINASAAPVLALDVPTGLQADSGARLGTAVQADLTVTFVGLKPGLYVGRGPEYTGAIAFADLDIPADAARGLEPVMRRITQAELAAALPRRRRTAHKGHHGRVVLVGGGPGMGGAIRLAAEAALRTGAGLVYVGTHPDNIASVMAGRPEIMCRPIAEAAALDPLLELADAVVLGPGLGREAWGRAVYERVGGFDGPLVADADALNLLAEAPAPCRGWMLTPHPGEAARLLDVAAQEIQRDRLAAVRALAVRFDTAVVLKGACTLVATPPDGGGEPAVGVCDRGNPGMASGGMGDALAGIIGALAGQCGDAALALRAAVLLHALAGDDAAADGERGMVAGDLMPHIRRRANPV